MPKGISYQIHEHIYDRFTVIIHVYFSQNVERFYERVKLVLKKNTSLFHFMINLTSLGIIPTFIILRA